MKTVEPVFCYVPEAHAYYVNGSQVPSITEMLERDGWIDGSHYTPESAERGTAVHALTAASDCGLGYHASGHSPYLLAYRAATGILRPAWSHIEQPMVHPDGWAGTPDRVGLVDGLKTVLEIKTGSPERWHSLQLALQAMLVAAQPDEGLPAEQWQRLTVYLRPNGTFRIEESTRRQDFAKARDILKACVP